MGQDPARAGVTSRTPPSSATAVLAGVRVAIENEASEPALPLITADAIDAAVTSIRALKSLVSIQR